MADNGDNGRPAKATPRRARWLAPSLGRPPGVTIRKPSANRVGSQRKSGRYCPECGHPKGRCVCQARK